MVQVRKVRKPIVSDLSRLAATRSWEVAQNQRTVQSPNGPNMIGFLTFRIWPRPLVVCPTYVLQTGQVRQGLNVGFGPFRPGIAPWFCAPPSPFAASELARSGRSENDITWPGLDKRPRIKKQRQGRNVRQQ